MINADIKDIKQLEQNLLSVSKSAYPKTVRSTLDREAFLAHEQYKKNVQK